MEVRYKCVQSGENIYEFQCIIINHFSKFTHFFLDIQTAVSCESLPVNLSCPAGKVLKIVKANYGRTDTVTCVNPNMHQKNCYAAGSTVIAGNMYVLNFFFFFQSHFNNKQ